MSQNVYFHFTNGLLFFSLSLAIATLFYKLKRKKIEEALRNSNERWLKSQEEYHELLNTVDGIVWESEVGGTGYSFVSEQAERILGYPLKDWYEKPLFWQTLLHPGDHARMTGNGYISALAKQDARIEYRLKTHNDRFLWIRDYIKIIPASGGSPLKMRGIMVDITQQKEIEEKLQQAQKVAEEASKIKTEFLANISHEIRTPLNAILGMTTVVLDTRMTEDQHDCLATIKIAADSLLILVNDILDFSKAEAGGLRLENAEFNLHQVAQSAMDVISSLAHGKSIDLKLEIRDNVSELYFGDSDRILQVLLNLLSNAVKFTPPHGTASLFIAASGDKMRFEIRDTGAGIPDEAKTRIFQPFTQVDNSMSRKVGGTGLGLSICKRLVTLMNGQIGFESHLGSGSTFWFELPLAAVVKVSPPTLTEHVAGNLEVIRGDLQTQTKRLNILIAEDNPASQKVIRRLMDKLKFNAEIVSDGTEALDRFNLRQFDLILMDCQMPNMDGYEATMQIRKIESSHGTRPTPIIAFTAHVLSGDKEKCVNAGMNDYLSKPVGLAQLRNTILKWTAQEVL